MSINFGVFLAPPSVTELIILSIADGVTQVDQELGKASLGGCIVSKNIGKRRIAEWFGETLSQGLAGTVVIAEPSFVVSISFFRHKGN